MLWLVTFVTHNSRVSERMVRYGIRPGKPVIFQPDDQELIAVALMETAQKQGIRVLALNVLPDHVHMIIDAESEARLTDSVRKFKGYAAYKLRNAHRATTGNHVWAEKFNRRPIRDTKTLRNMLHYVMCNHLKHVERWGESLITTWEERIRPIAESACGPNLAGMSEIL